MVEICGEATDGLSFDSHQFRDKYATLPLDRVPTDIPFMRDLYNSWSSTVSLLAPDGRIICYENRANAVSGKMRTLMRWLTSEQGEEDWHKLDSGGRGIACEVLSHDVLSAAFAGSGITVDYLPEQMDQSGVVKGNYNDGADLVIAVPVDSTRYYDPILFVDVKSGRNYHSAGVNETFDVPVVSLNFGSLRVPVIGAGGVMNFRDYMEVYRMWMHRKDELGPFPLVGEEDSVYLTDRLLLSLINRIKGGVLSCVYSQNGDRIKNEDSFFGKADRALQAVRAMITDRTQFEGQFFRI